MRLGQATIYGVASTEQHVDILTKPLGSEAFQRHRDFRVKCGSLFDRFERVSPFSLAGQRCESGRVFYII